MHAWIALIAKLPLIALNLLRAADEARAHSALMHIIQDRFEARIVAERS